MRGKSARPYVASIFEDGRKYYREDIQEKVDQHFGIGTYTEKQIRDLLGNMVKSGQLSGGAREGYQRKLKQQNELTESRTNGENSFFVMGGGESNMYKDMMNKNESGTYADTLEFVKDLIEKCDEFKKYCDEPNFFSRIGKNADLNYMLRTYNEVKKTRRRLASLIRNS